MVMIDIDMPTDCSSCWVRQNMGCKIANESGWLNNKRDDRCPLKEQEAVKPRSKSRHGAYPQFQHFCGNCNAMLHGKPKFCSTCGRKVKWE